MSDPRPSARPFGGLGLDLLIWAASVLPFFVPHLPLEDWPNHLARQFIAFELPGSPDLQAHYAYDWHFVPNLAFDAFVQGLAPIFGVEASGRLFMFVTCALLYFGARAVSRVTDGGAGYRIVPLLFYSGPFQLGQLSYEFGLGLSLFAFAIFVRAIRRPSPALYAACAGFCLLLLASHLAALMVYGAVSFTYALGRWLYGRIGRAGPESPRGMIFACGQVIPAGLYFVSQQPTRTPGGSVLYGLSWGPIHKVEAMLAPMLYNAPKLELGLFVALLVGLVFLLWRRALRLDPLLGAGAAAVIVLTLIVPSNGIEGSMIDYRLPSAAWLFALPAISVAAVVPKVERGIMALLLGLVALRIAIVGADWVRFQPVLAEIEASFEQIPIGARVEIIGGEAPSLSVSRRPSVLEWPTLAAGRRHAFMPQLFGNLPSHHLLTIKANGGKVSWIELYQEYDVTRFAPDTYLYVLDPKDLALRGTERLGLVGTGQRYALFHVEGR